MSYFHVGVEESERRQAVLQVISYCVHSRIVYSGRMFRTVS